MITTEIFIEDYKLDLLQDISTEFTYAIDDISDFGSKNTSYSKTISLSGTARNNQIFGFVFDMGNANFTDDNLPNVNYNFNASKSAQCRIFIDKVQIFKGTLRILEIVIEGKTIEYQCSVFGELGGFITSLGNSRLEDLDFSAYNHIYSISNITNSWNSINGTSYYYPLIDFGSTTDNLQVSSDKINFNVLTFRPALYVNEYIDKIIKGNGYTYILDLSSGDEQLYKRLIIPHNQKALTKSTNEILVLNKTTSQNMNEDAINDYVQWDTNSGGLFTPNIDKTEFTYNSTTATTITFNITINGSYNTSNQFTISVRKNGSEVTGSSQTYSSGSDLFTYSKSLTISLVQNDVLTVRFFSPILGVGKNITIDNANAKGISSTPTLSPIIVGDTIVINDTIPKGVYQRDFFLSIAKMFNLYIYDSVWDDKKILMKPYVNFYEETSENALDWSNKIDRSKPLSIKPMSELNARYYHYKFKDDNDFFNDNYKKKFNENYGDRIYDTNYDFSKDTDELSLIFAPSILYQANTTDKIYPAIYKKSNSNTKEDAMDSVIRILQAKKITGVTSWYIKSQDNSSNLSSALTAYGYAGHLDDPNNPTNDINFGAPKELQFTVGTYPTTNLFNAYYSPYMAEITNKDSKLLTCNALLNTIDINNLDFSKYIWIDGVLFRLNKVEGFNPMEYNTTKISLLKVIETTY